MSKLILGTAQFGQPYGIKGDPVPSLKEIEKIAQVAWDGGIRIIHTSWQYNLAEEIFDMFSKHDWEIISKNENFPQEFMSSRRDGISIYEIKDLELLKGYDYDVVQIPLNVLDNRFLDQARKKFLDYEPDGLKEIHARSVFLQGLLLIDKLPDWIAFKTIFVIHDFWDACKKEEIEPYEAALGWVLGLEEINKVIVGVNSAKQLEELLHVKPLKWDYDFSITDDNVLDPRRWPKS